MEKGITYLNRTFYDYKDALLEYSKKYYPDLNLEYDDASVASWLIDLNAAIADNLSYHIDRVYQETNLDSAQERKSLLNIARNNGVKIPGPKAAMAEVRLWCVLGVDQVSHPDWSYAPIIKRGTKVGSANGQEFEVLEDVDFAQQFNQDGISDRTFTPNLNANGVITGYTVSKLAVVVAGESLIYRQNIAKTDIRPFMEVVLPIENVMNIESILVVPGNSKEIPTYGAFYSEVEECENGVRFFEVDSLSQTERWAPELDVHTNAAKKYYYGYDYSGGTVASYCITKGEWKPVKHKFITEYMDNGYMKIIFGAGNNYEYPELGDSMSDFAKWQISRMISNDSLGLLPNQDSTMFILYRLGGGRASNLARGAINRISYLNAEFRGSDQSVISEVNRSLGVISTTPSVSGKDFPSNTELKYIVKYNKGAQERCVCVKDYIDRLLQLPPKYGTPFRLGVVEQNNKVVVYVLGLNYLGQLDTLLPITLIKNIERYLSKYKMLNDYVEIKSGRIINLEFQVDVIVDKNYNKSDVVSSIINTIKDYMDINKHLMGEEIYVGDIEKEVSKIDGVLNLIDLAVYNKMDMGYSNVQVSQPIMLDDSRVQPYASNKVRIDLEESDWILYNEGDTMMEIKNPSEDILVRVKER